MFPQKSLLMFGTIESGHAGRVHSQKLVEARLIVLGPLEGVNCTLQVSSATQWTETVTPQEHT